MSISPQEIIKKANALIARCKSRDPNEIAAQLNITILRRPFQKQLGAYRVLLNNAFIFLNENLDPVMERIVLSHEIAHHVLHRAEAVKAGGFQEFELFNMRGQRMEYEANLFVAQVTLPDDEFLTLAGQGFDTQQMAMALNSDINLVALKCDTLRAQGYELRPQEHRSDFLRYDK